MTATDLAFAVLTRLAHVKHRRFPGLVEHEAQVVARARGVSDPELIAEAIRRVQEAEEHLRSVG